MTEPEMCCGGTCVRALCTFHAPPQVAAPSRIVSDDSAYLDAFFAALERWMSEGNPRELRCIGLDDPEVSDRMCYLTPEGGVVYR